MRYTFVNSSVGDRYFKCSYIIFKGKLCYINEISDTWTMFFNSSRVNSSYKIRNKKIIFDIPICGAINLCKEVYTISRSPSRYWKMGLCSGNTFIYNDSFSRQPLFSLIINSNSFLKLQKNIYPSFNEALMLIKDFKLNSLAINREFYIKNDSFIYIKVRKPIGVIEKDRVMLLDRFKYLNKKLYKAGVNL